MSAVSYFAGSGLSNAEPVGAFLNGNFPDVSASSNPYKEVFPNITFDSPLTFTPVPNSDILIVGQRNGEIYWFENENSATKNLLVDMSNEVGVTWDGGFLGLAIHPQFGQAGKNYFYLYYTTKDAQGRDYPNGFITGFGCDKEDYWGNFLILKRIEVNPTTFTKVANSDLEMIKMRMFSSTHRGGGIAFGNDGYLYIPTGDQSAYNKPQNSTTNLDGGVLRIDVDQNPNTSHPPTRTLPTGGRFADEVSGVGYYIPDDNPFLTASGSNFEEYYTIGHRNPHRMTVDRLTGTFYIGEIGESTHEEINVIEKGKNYGWPVYEGYQFRGTCTTMQDGMPHQGPLVAFPRSQANALIGGYVYRGAAMPDFYGKYICADYGTGEEIWAVDINTGEYELITQFSPTNIISFGEDNNGELYLLSQGNNVKMYKLVQNGELEGTVPELLSETGAFKNLETLEPNDGVLPYDLIEPFWSDGAEKKRWLVIPNDGTHNTPAEQISFSENGDWQFPTGSVLIKHFELPVDENNPSETKRLETRFSVKTTEGSFYYKTYKWNAAGTDAVLLEQGLEEDIQVRLQDGTVTNQTWVYPSSQDCISCHNPATGGTLGTRTRYLNSEITYDKTGLTANQLVTLSHLGILDEAINDAQAAQFQTYKALEDETASLDERARSYMDLNCAYCHRPGGTGDRAQFDLRLFNTLQQTGLLSSGTNTPIGIPGERILVPGNADQSILYHRTASTDPSIMMPPIAKKKVDDKAVALLEAWINQLDPDLEVPTIEEARYALINVGSGLYVDVAGASQADRADIIQWNPNGGANQEYYLESVGTGVYSFRALHSTKYFDVESQGQTPGTNLIQYQGNGTIAQQFTLEYVEEDQWLIKSVANNLYLGIENNSVDLGASVKTYINDGSNFFKWRLVNLDRNPVTGITTSLSEVSLVEGETVTVTATVQPTNATEQGIVWTSNDEAIATVDNQGTITAVSSGSTVLTATSIDGDFTAEVAVIVESNFDCSIIETEYQINNGQYITDVSSIQINEGSRLVLSIIPNQYQFSISGPNGNEKELSLQDLVIEQITLQDAGVYTIETEQGCLLEVNVEVAAVDCTNLGLETEYQLNQTGPYITGDANVSILEGETITLSIIPNAVRFSVTGPNDIFKELNFQDLTLSNVTSAQSGIYIFTTDSGCETELLLNVVPEPTAVTGVTLAAENLTLTEGDTTQLVATVSPTDASDSSVSWESSDTSIITVDENGNVIAVSEGNATVTVTTTDGGFKATASVVVEPIVIPVTGITLSEDEITLIAGETAQIIATVSPLDASNRTVSWESSDEFVATVDANGAITAVAEGSAIIIATTNDGGFIANANVIVEPITIPVTGITINPTSSNLTIGESIQLIATVNPNDASNTTVNWTVSDPSVVSIDNSGLVNALAEGIARITVSTEDGGFSATSTITVTAPTSQDLPWIEDFTNLQNGSTVDTGETAWSTTGNFSVLNEQLRYQVDYTTENPATFETQEINISGYSDVSISFTVTDENLNSKEEVDYLRAYYRLDGGTRVLLAEFIDDIDLENFTISGIQGSSLVVEFEAKSSADNEIFIVDDLRVEETNTSTIPVTGVSLNTSEVNLVPNATYTLISTITPVNATDKTVTWLSSNPSIASVDADGKIIALNPGNATVTVTTVDGNYSASANVLVSAVPNQELPWIETFNDLVNGSKLDNGETAWIVDGSIQVTNGQLRYQTDYSSNDPATFTTEQINIAGNANVSISFIIDDEDLGAKEEVDFLRAYYTVDNGERVLIGEFIDDIERQLITVEGIEGDNLVIEFEVWCSADNEIFVVDDLKVEANNPSEILVTGVSLNPQKVNLTANQTFQLAAIVSPSNATNTTVSWSSSDDSVATVNSNGLVTANAVGNAIITVTTIDGGYTAISEIEVGEEYIPVRGVSLDVTEGEVPVGFSGTVTATINPENATDKSVVWSSSDESVGVVDQNGNVTAVGPGTVIITVTTNDGGYTAQLTGFVSRSGATSTFKISFDELEKLGKSISALTIAPNPVEQDSNMQLHFASFVSSNAEINIYDYSGKIVLTVSRPVNKGQNSTEVAIRQLASGNYFVSVRVEDEILVQKVLIK
ncbi:hypothetical protein GCM10011414_28290 [Croceivirga lutea]|nr:hypothetical protein GCM10011414_28290 [Croceivirga lutea]